MKAIVMIGMSVGATLGAFVPMLFGNSDPLSAWSFLTGLIGGIIGIWLAVKLAKAAS